MMMFEIFFNILRRDGLLTFFKKALLYIKFQSQRVLKKLWYGYYIKNFFEGRKNRQKLITVRKIKSKSIDESPLISVIIPTYNRSKILFERAVKSVLKQTYKNFELIIIGDHCTDNTEELIKSINDSRIIFLNLNERGIYPSNKLERWMVAGTVPSNKGLDLVTGDWIAFLDDDDEFSDDHLEVLLKFALKNDYEMVYGIIQAENAFGEWENLGSFPLKEGCITRISVLYQSKLSFIKNDVNSWKYLEPADWNLWRRMNEAGVRIGFINYVVGKYYKA